MLEMSADCRAINWTTLRASESSNRSQSFGELGRKPHHGCQRSEQLVADTGKKVALVLVQGFKLGDTRLGELSLAASVLNFESGHRETRSALGLEVVKLSIEAVKFPKRGEGSVAVAERLEQVCL